MKALGKVTAQQILHFGVFEIFLTIIACYTIAVAFGHVHPWLPMISDCAVRSPEKYLFRIGVVFGASLIGLQSFIVYYADKDKRCSFLELLLSLIGSVSVGIVGVVNEQENHLVHLIFALVFFFCFNLYMTLSVLAYCITKSTRGITRKPFVIKTVCAIVGTIAGTRSIFLFAAEAMQEPTWAMCEWIDAFAIMIFIWSHMLLDDVEIIEVKVKRKVQ